MAGDRETLFDGLYTDLQRFSPACAARFIENVTGSELSEHDVAVALVGAWQATADARRFPHRGIASRKLTLRLLGAMRLLTRKQA